MGQRTSQPQWRSAAWSSLLYDDANDDYNHDDDDDDDDGGGAKENVARLEIKLKEMELQVETREGEERKVTSIDVKMNIVHCWF